MLWRDANGKPLRAEIADFKTDRFSSPQERTAIETRYAPQLAAYREALCLLCPGLDKASVATALTFVLSGENARGDFAETES